MNYGIYQRVVRLLRSDRVLNVCMVARELGISPITAKRHLNHAVSCGVAESCRVERANGVVGRDYVLADGAGYGD